MSSVATPGNGELLDREVRRALCETPLKLWGFFFPFLVALWRFVGASRPGLLGQLEASYEAEPKFAGKGAKWFCGTLLDDPVILDRVERFMYWMVGQVPASARERGFLLASELPTFDKALIDEIGRVVLARADETKNEASK